MSRELPPLTHHEIIRIVEPFARAGIVVDLAGSDRPGRRIAFRGQPVDIAATPGEPWMATLELSCPGEDFFVLRRRLVHPDGQRVELEASGASPAELLARIQAVPPDRQVRSGPGWRVARNYDADLPRGARMPPATEGPPLVMTAAQVRAGGLTLDLRMKLPGLRGVAADLALQPADGRMRELPEDLLAVLGWDWARLIRQKDGWISKLRLRGAVLRRSRMAEPALERAAAHLARVMAEPPAAFHDRHRLARWGVVLRRGIPSMMIVLMIGGALMLPKVLDPEKAGMWMALHYVPIALLALAFSLQELARFEIPPLPRRSRAATWDGAGAAVQGA